MFYDLKGGSHRVRALERIWLISLYALSVRSGRYDLTVRAMHMTEILETVSTATRLAALPVAQKCEGSNRRTERGVSQGSSRQCPSGNFRTFYPRSQAHLRIALQTLVPAAIWPGLDGYSVTIWLANVLRISITFAAHIFVEPGTPTQ
jgi:hypothetical protein